MRAVPLIAALLFTLTASSVSAPAGTGRPAADGQRSIEQFRSLSGPSESAGSRARQQTVTRTLERARQIDGTTYGVIAPTFDGSSGTLSFFRFFNGQGADGSSAQPAIFIVTAVGSPSGKTYGTLNIAVPAGAAPQYSLTDILTSANTGALTGVDSSWALYVQLQRGVATAGYQHVIYNNANGFFENVSVCDSAYAGLSDNGYANGGNNSVLYLQNVHTSALANYPAQVYIHNYGGQDTTYQVKVIDARTGAAIGDVNVDTLANATYSLPETYFEQQLKWTPASNQPHVNLIFQDLNNTGYAAAVVSQFILNRTLSASINMTVSCFVPGP